MSGEVHVIVVEKETPSINGDNETDIEESQTYIKHASEYFGPWSTYDNSWTYATATMVTMNYQKRIIQSVSAEYSQQKCTV